MAITLLKRNGDIPSRRDTGYMSGTYTAASVTNALLTTTNNDANGFSVTSAGVTTTIGQRVVVASGVLTITLGFSPKYVKVWNATSRIQKEWFEGMNVTDSLLTVAAGTRSLVTTSGVLLSSQAAGGSAPVTTEPTSTVAITFATDSLVADNDTWGWVITG